MNKVKYNLKNVYYSLLTETVGDSGTTTYIFANPAANVTACPSAMPTSKKRLG